ncbi:hypothetical protein SAMN05216420_101323 [Nitrosospira sp. Nl5]|nr:hypothetical protein SAMN05216420_101323 [Nitrosospira sp. Nl5]
MAHLLALATVYYCPFPLFILFERPHCGVVFGAAFSSVHFNHLSSHSEPVAVLTLSSTTLWLEELEPDSHF